jgi:uncharacterized membrane protein
MKDIPLNATIEGTDGEAGQSTHIIINPINRQVTHFVVQMSREGEISDHLVPLEAVENTSHDRIWVKLTVDELAELPDFTVNHYLKAELSDYPEDQALMQPYVTTPAVANLNRVVEEMVPPGQMALFRGTTVEATDGPIGKLSELLIEPESGQMSHLVVHTGGLLGRKEIILPLSAIAETTEEAIYLKLDKAAVEQLPAVPLRRHYLIGDETRTELVAIFFETPEKAGEMLDFLNDLQKRGTLKLRNAAVLSKDNWGKVSFKETEDVDAWRGTLFGAVTGGLIGLLGGPIGMLVGSVAGASAGGVAADWIDLGFPDEFLKKLEIGLEPGKAALVLLVEHEWLENLSETMTGMEGVVLQHSLTEEMVNRFIAGSQ